MSERHQLALDGPSEVPGGKRAKDLQELWFALARRPWTTIVLAPAASEGSAEEVARSLADVGKHVSDSPITAISMNRLGPGSARALATLNDYLRRERDRPTSLWKNGVVDVDPTVVDARPVESATGDMTELFAPGLSGGRLIIAIPSLIAEPLGLAVTQSADSVVLSIELGRTRMADARRSIELVGRDRIAGCYIVG